MRLILAAFAVFFVAGAAQAQSPPCYAPQNFIDGMKKEGLKLVSRGISAQDGSQSHVFADAQSGKWMIADLVPQGCFVPRDFGNSYEPTEAAPRPFSESGTLSEPSR